MNLRRRALTVCILTATACGALGAPAMAMPMPWETSNVPATASATDGQSNTASAQDGNPWHGVAPAGTTAAYGNPWHGLAPALPMPWETGTSPAVPSAADGRNGTVTVLCSGSCYE
ncbi:hypothetical protein QFZ63_007056 [Streptomyces sp. B3I7]|uniref:hypothetical protein n=1 Tax=unclassified Streptomyces TaxID=2593676 RepID=UPI00277F53C3|nr:MULTISPECIES: hypothetical protein [unclassified Streptomyces]MDQ0785033.1 hypothetical protein [Streptomyces sp. B3I8]MDQ0815342.1 hypothetical protein [Streptomyces sp. B3I7]